MRISLWLIMPNPTNLTAQSKDSVIEWSIPRKPEVKPWTLWW